MHRHRADLRRPAAGPCGRVGYPRRPGSRGPPAAGRYSCTRRSCFRRVRPRRAPARQGSIKVDAADLPETVTTSAATFPPDRTTNRSAEQAGPPAPHSAPSRITATSWRPATAARGSPRDRCLAGLEVAAEQDQRGHSGGDLVTNQPRRACAAGRSAGCWPTTRPSPVPGTRTPHMERDPVGGRITRHDEQCRMK